MICFQIYAIITSKGNPIIAASGIQVDSNCRRFVVDERRDQYYRAEVQNRVYKREVVEVGRLFVIDLLLCIHPMWRVCDCFLVWQITRLLIHIHINH